MRDNDEIVLYSDPNIIEWKSVEGWVGKDNRFYGEDEHTARYVNSTHMECEKGHIYKKWWSRCQKCREKELPSRYMRLEYKDWDRETPLVIFESDTYFFNEEDLINFIEEEGYIPDNLVICKPIYLREVEEDYWDYAIPEDLYLEDVNYEIYKQVNILNSLINKAGPVSWRQGKFRTSYDYEID